MVDVGFDDGVEFYGFSKQEQIHRLAIEGEKLWSTLFERDNDFGGWLVEITGLMGRGKTSLMLEMVNKTIKDFPDEIIMWRESPLAPIQAAKNGDNFQLLVEKSFPMRVFQLGKTRPFPTDKYKIRYFDGIAKLMDMLQPGMINCIYFKHQWKWVDLLIRLRFNTSWQSIYFDEMEDVVPAHCSNKGTDRSWTYNHKFVNHIKQIRKSRVNVIYNSQTASDIWWDFRRKIMMHIYLGGSIGDSFSPVYQSMLQNLKIGEAVIDLGFSLFGKITFDAYRPKKELYALFPIGKGGRMLRNLS